MTSRLLSQSVFDLSRRHPALADFLVGIDPGGAKPDRTLATWLDGLSDDRLADAGMGRDQILVHVEALTAEIDARRTARIGALRALTIHGGVGKDGRPEDLDLTIVPGDVVCVVGPTGSGKSRLLADIECLAQGDTPSRRRMLVDGMPPDPARRFASNGKLIAQLSQNMNFVVDLSVEEFVGMHADCRLVPARDEVVAEVIACANDLAGERFTPHAALTQLSGGQARALMIADTALLSASPVVLIDEIENAGVDRKRALDLLIAREKIVLIATHDPVLALMGDRRLVLGHGAVTAVIETTPREKANLAGLERINRELMRLRTRLRTGETIDAPLDWLLDAAVS